MTSTETDVEQPASPEKVADLESEEEEVDKASSTQEVSGKKDLQEEDVLIDESSPTGRRIRLALCSAGLLLGFVLCFVEMGGNRKINQTMSIAIWMATLWLTETIPLVVTAFLPLFLFPLFGILSGATVASKYVGNTIFLFIAGFMVALALERWNLHRRFSLKILSWCGAKPGSILFGMMFSTFFLSMFVSNTATALMMVPNAVSVCESLERSGRGQDQRESKLFGTAVMLGIAYAANVGGMASLIGTPPNLVLQAQLETLFPEAPELTFATWLGFGFPIGLVSFLAAWLYLRLTYLRNFTGVTVERSFFSQEYQALGTWSREQVTVSLMFIVLALLWIFRPDLVFSSFTIKGWSNIFPQPSFVSDATVGMLFAVIMFVTPARTAHLADDHRGKTDQDKEWSTLLNWETANKMPYDIVFLFGGGFALAQGFTDSGLSAFLGDKLGGTNLSLVGVSFVMIFVIIWLTELTSNTSTSNIMIPIAAAVAVGLSASPYTLMIPATLACSCAFCLPMATPPNMVVFSSGRLTMGDMNKAGVALNIFCCLLIWGATFTIIPAVLGVAPSDFPEWAANSVIGN